ncbi:MAG: DUF3500 domain-containing protein [Gemmatimonadetes bacterium]|nr:DUF3500 domain-containing protein [Gemmatimonadota bacterium]
MIRFPRRAAWIVLFTIVVPGLLLATVMRDTGTASGQQQQDPLAEAFRGITTDGTIKPGLFAIRATGVSTAPIKQAADAFLGSLTPDQRARTSFAVDHIEWRRWNNIHRYAREGVSFRDLDAAQKERAWGLLRASLSAKGVQTSDGIMKLNGYVADLRDDHEAYGDDLYFFTVMGEPSMTEPWGWQLDGHHLIINYFVLGDQVVMTPTFMGSEPVSVTTGRYAGTTVLQNEQARGEALMRALRPDQRALAAIHPEKVRNHAQAQAFRDNLVLAHEGLRADQMDASQRELLVALIEEHIGNLREGHAKVRMDEIRRYLDATYFAWIGDSGPDAVFYYRVHSPVVLIEFDHQSPVALDGPRGVPTRAHVHSLVRTPNGNDYGKDLLRQHYEAHRDDPSHGHTHDRFARTGGK